MDSGGWKALRSLQENGTTYEFAIANRRELLTLSRQRCGAMAGSCRCRSTGGCGLLAGCPRGPDDGCAAEEWNEEVFACGSKASQRKRCLWRRRCWRRDESCWGKASTHGAELVQPGAQLSRNRASQALRCISGRSTFGKAILGTRHPDYAMSLDSLAMLCMDMGDLAGRYPVASGGSCTAGRWGRSTLAMPQPEQPGRALPGNGQTEGALEQSRRHWSMRCGRKRPGYLHLATHEFFEPAERVERLLAGLSARDRLTLWRANDDAAKPRCCARPGAGGSQRRRGGRRPARHPDGEDVQGLDRARLRSGCPQACQTRPGRPVAQSGRAGLAAFFTRRERARW